MPGVPILTLSGQTPILDPPSKASLYWHQQVGHGLLITEKTFGADSVNCLVLMVDEQIESEKQEAAKWEKSILPSLKNPNEESEQPTKKRK